VHLNFRILSRNLAETEAKELRNQINALARVIATVARSVAVRCAFYQSEAGDAQKY